MDDTKKLIEKYKRELMELSAKQKKSPQIIGYVDGDNNFLSNLQSDIIEESAPENSANSRSNSEVVFEGSNSAKSRDNSGKITEGSNSAKTEKPRDKFDMVFEESSSSDQSNSHTDPEMTCKECSSENQTNSRNNSDVVFERSSSADQSNSHTDSEMICEECSSANQTNSRGNSGMGSMGSSSENSERPCGDLEMSGMKNGSDDHAKNRGDSDVIFERSVPENSANSSDNITEIIDEYTPESPQKSRRISEKNEAPAYTEIPSAAQVRGEITENSKPQNNVIESSVSGITDNSAATPRADAADAIRTTAAQAERLNDQPVSGTDPGEQLTGRSFEGAEPLPDVDVSMEQGSRAEPIDYPEQNFSNFEEFERVNTGRGSLMFKVYTGREAVVIEGAECVITKKIGSETRTLARLVTDKSGQTPVQELPAPPKELSQHPENTIQPFALYDAEVTKPGFVRVVLKDVPVFDGVQSVQRVFMIVE